MRLRSILLPLVIAGGIWALLPPRQKPVDAGLAGGTGVGNQAGKSSNEPVPLRKQVIRVAPKLFYMPGNVPMGVGQPLQGLYRVEQRYEALHPEVDIQYISVPTAREWLVTQAAAGLLPDIVDVNVEEVWQDTHKGWYIPLDEYLARPSAYAADGEPGSVRWSDIFKYPAISESVVAPDGRTYCIVYDMVETGMFYNKEIFSKVGVSPPQDWQEYHQMQRKLREAGYIPTLALITDLADWATDLLFDQLYQPILPVLDLRPEHPDLKEFRDGYLDWDEIAFLYSKGFFSKSDPRFVELWRLMKEWRGHMGGSLSAADNPRLFLIEKGATLWSGSWQVHQFTNDPTMDFDWDVFYLPPVTEKTSRFANGHPQVVIGGPGTQFVVTSSAIADTGSSATSERLKRCIDFLQFLTTPESVRDVVKEVAVFLPNHKLVEARPEHAQFSKFLERRSSISKWQFTFDMRFNEIMSRMLELYLNGGVTEAEYLDWMQRNIESSIETAVRRHKPDFTPLQKRWEELAPLRATIEGLPDAAR